MLLGVAWRSETGDLGAGGKLDRRQHQVSKPLLGEGAVVYGRHDITSPDGKEGLRHDNEGSRSEQKWLEPKWLRTAPLPEKTPFGE